MIDGNGKPPQSVAGLWNLSFGFFGIQVGFALQNANVSRIFQSLGTTVDSLPILWIAAPLTGLLVQPLIGHLSDRTWGRFGRRRPYFALGAALATFALVAMPNSGSLLAAALLLWALDASLNISMEPFRAFVGDMLPARQRPAGYAFQTGFIGAGAVAASLAPILLNDVLGVPNVAPAGDVPLSVRLAFYIGAAALLFAILWTVFTTREYSPEELARFEDSREPDRPQGGAEQTGGAHWWLAAGLAEIGAVWALGLDPQLYLLGALLVFFALAKFHANRRVARGRGADAISAIVSDLSRMPPTMKKLAAVQFFTWSALFIMWIFMTPVVAQNAFGSGDPATAAYNRGADWVGVMFAVYNGVAALWAFALPRLCAAIGRRNTHVLGLAAGAAGYAGIFILKDPHALIGAMVLVGIAWSSILTMPYAILCDALPQRKLGVYMGLFNIFIVLPQITVAVAMGPLVKALFPANPLPTMLIAAAAMLAAAMVTLMIQESDDSAPDAAPVDERALLGSG